MMPLCVKVAEDGQLVATGQLADTCSGYVLTTVADYAQSLTLTQAFGMPDIPQLVGLFSLGAGLCVTLAIVSHLVGSVAGFFGNSSREETL